MTRVDDMQSAIEARAGVDALTALQEMRRELVQQAAPLRAKYGPGGSWDARRKAHRSAVANALADEAQREGGKAPSEAALERLAAADPRVVALLDVAEVEMAAWLVLENQITDLTERIRSREAELRFATAEARL